MTLWEHLKLATYIAFSPKLIIRTLILPLQTQLKYSQTIHPKY